MTFITKAKILAKDVVFNEEQKLVSNRISPYFNYNRYQLVMMSPLIASQIAPNQ